MSVQGIDPLEKWTPPAEWPVRSRKDAAALLCAPGQPFEMEMVEIDGVATRVWKNAAPSLAALAELGRSHGDAEFLIFADERVTYANWYRAVAALAVELQHMGVSKGDRVSLAMRNLPEWPVIFFAAASIGAIVVPLNAWWTDQELLFGLANSETSVLLCDAERWDRVSAHLADLPELKHVIVARGQSELAQPARALEDIIGKPNDYAKLPDQNLPAVDIAPDDPATIFYTSGTTGQPKGALGSHRNLTTNAISVGYSGAAAALRRGDEIPEPTVRVGLTVVPMFHCTACSAIMMP
ncbi:MAG: class I adenylate-forming enzyme family protein, partial [Parasphingorhabdus sp.]